MLAQAVIFDLDGTLLDSLADIGESMNLALASMGLPVHPLDAYRAFVGDGVAMLARRALPEHCRNEKDVAGAVARMREIYQGRCTQNTRPYRGIPALLDELEARATRKAVLSNKPHDLTVALVGSVLGAWRFEPVFGERPSVPRKPDPCGALEIAARLALDPSRILYVGDTAIDIATARAARMVAVGAAWGFRSEAELLAAGASAIVRRPLEVLEYLH